MTRSAQHALKKPPILFERTQKILAQIEAKLGKRLITYWNSDNGSICGDDVNGLYGILRDIETSAPDPAVCGEAYSVSSLGL
jgi:hypothetical protein